MRIGWRNPLAETKNRNQPTLAACHTNNRQRQSRLARYMDMLLRGNVGSASLPSEPELKLKGYSKNGDRQWSSSVPVSQLSQPDQPNQPSQPSQFQFSPPTRDENADMEAQEVQIKEALQCLAGDRAGQWASGFSDTLQPKTRWELNLGRFEAFFKKDLARRLLLQRSACSEMEHFASSLLQKERGDAYTTGALLEDVGRCWSAQCWMIGSYNGREPVPLVDTRCLATSRGRGHRVPGLGVDHGPLAVPALESRDSAAVSAAATCDRGRTVAQLAQLRWSTSFASFYIQQHPKRSLRWCPAWGQCLLRANFLSSRKELVVSHFQALVLLCFNAGVDRLSYEEIWQKTQIPEADLKLTLQSLSLHKTVKLLLQLGAHGGRMGGAIH
eukprot:Skav233361  [mRNA]  locus=scaffold394:573676:577849:+ [translate_table: standard]